MFVLWKQAVVAEWLRRLTWNQMVSPRVGSNPAGCVKIFFAQFPTNFDRDKENSMCDLSLLTKQVQLCQLVELKISERQTNIAQL